jgi:SPP1 family predicted phage head-tail adaptor
VKPNLNSEFPTVNPGDFRHQIILLEQTIGSDAAGANVSYDAAPVTAWAKIDFVRGSELIRAGQDVSQSVIKVTMWYRPEFAVSQRIQVPDGSTFIIQYVENVKMMNMYQVLTALGIGAND